jgi:hypothetical protein
VFVKISSDPNLGKLVDFDKGGALAISVSSGRWALSLIAPDDRRQLDTMLPEGIVSSMSKLRGFEVACGVDAVSLAIKKLKIPVCSIGQLLAIAQ